MTTLDTALGECPRCGGTTYHDGEIRTCQDCPYEETPQSSSAAGRFTVVCDLYEVRESHFATLAEAVDCVHRVLYAQPFALICVLDANGAVVYDVEQHDSCTLHPEVGGFSKEGPCPACAPVVNIPCDACGALPLESCTPDCTALVSASNRVEDVVRDALDKVTDALSERQIEAIVRRVVTGLSA